EDVARGRRIAGVESRPRMIGERVEDTLIAELGPIELLPVFVKQSQVDEGADVGRKRRGSTLIKLQSGVVVAAAIVFDGQPEQGARVLTIDLDRPLQQRNHFGRGTA